MESVLDNIIERKKIEVQSLKMAGHVMGIPAHPTRSLIKVLNETKDVAIISEFKRASPSKGDLNLQLEPDGQARLYADAGAAAISVLTDEKGFKGSFADLEKVRHAVDLPILCKDFIIDRIQVDLARSSGADVILLIASVLKIEELAELYAYASSKEMECLVEIHDKNDLEKAIGIHAAIIGINNRDLKTFEVNLENTEKLGPLVKKAGALLISESGLKTREDVLRAADAGANGVLVGETMMKSTDLQTTFSEFKIPLGKRS